MDQVGAGHVVNYYIQKVATDKIFVDGQVIREVIQRLYVYPDHTVSPHFFLTDHYHMEYDIKAIGAYQTFCI